MLNSIIIKEVIFIKNNDNISNNKSIGLDKFSYADFVVLSSIISYSIAEELSETDLELLVSFLSMISSDLALLLVKKGIEKDKLNQTSSDTNQGVVADSIPSGPVRSKRIRKVKKVRKVKR